MIKIIWLIATVYFKSRLFKRVFASVKEINNEVQASDVIVDVETVEPTENNGSLHLICADRLMGRLISHPQLACSASMPPGPPINRAASPWCRPPHPAGSARPSPPVMPLFGSWPEG